MSSSDDSGGGKPSALRPGLLGDRNSLNQRAALPQTLRANRQTSFYRSFFQSGDQSNVLPFVDDLSDDPHFKPQEETIPEVAAAAAVATAATAQPEQVDLPAGVAVPRYRPMGRRNLSFRGLPPGAVGGTTSPGGTGSGFASSSRSSCSSRSSVSSLGGGVARGSLKAPPEEMALEDYDDFDDDEDMAAAAAAALPKPRMLSTQGRQQSWYREALAQGMSKGDLAVLLGDDMDDSESADSDLNLLSGGQKPPRAAAAAAAAAAGVAAGRSSMNSQASAGTAGSGGESLEEEVLEQYRIMAHHEARQRAKERLGYDPAERRESQRMCNMKPAPEEANDTIALPQLRPPQLPLPPPNTAACEPPPIFAAINNANGAGGSRSTLNGTAGKTKNIFIDSFAPKRKSWMEQKCRRPRELQVGTTSTSTVPPPGQMIVRCLGCRKQLVVGMLATLVSCEECLTVSPASSTRK